MIQFVYDDGGRGKAGFKGIANDCVTRAIAIATGKPYKEVYGEINSLAKLESSRQGGKKRSSARTGVNKATTKKYLISLGWKWNPVMKIGEGARMHLHSDELPKEQRVIVALSRHYAAVIDGVLYDTHDSSRDGSRCVYGYWTHAPTC